MAELKPTVHGVENHRSSEYVHRSRAAVHDEVKGRDFTLDNDDMPKGYYRSFSFLGSVFAIRASLASGTWVALAYLLTPSIGMSIIGRMSDLFGRRWFYIGAAAVATVGSIVGATAKSVETLIAAEVILGLGASVQIIYGSPIGEFVPMKYRFWAQGYVVLWTIPTSGPGPAVAYAFVYQSGVGWRGIYFLIALNALSTAALFLCYRPPSFHMKHGNNTRMQFLKNFDYFGAFLFIAGLLLFLMGLSWGGTIHPWKSGAVIATIVIGFFLLFAFVAYEALANLKEPFVPVHLFKNRAFVVSTLLWSLGASVYYANAILWPSMVNSLFAAGHGVTWAGWVSCLPNAAITLGEIFAPLGTILKHRHWQIRFAFLVGSVLVACMATCTPDTTIRAMCLIFFGSLFIGYNEIANWTVLTLAIDDQREIGTGTGITSSLRNTISTICSTVFTTVLANRLAENIPARVPQAVMGAGLPQSPVAAYLTALTSGSADAMGKVEGITSAIENAGSAGYKIASSDAYKTVFLVSLAFSGTGMLISIFFSKRRYSAYERGQCATTRERPGDRSRRAR